MTDRRESVSERLTDFRQLNVWQKAHKIVLDVYEITKKFPKEEKTELVSQIRQSASLVPIKIAEGFLRRNPKEKEVAYKRSQETLEEVKYFLILAGDLDYMKDNSGILESVEEVGRMLSGLVRSVRA